MTQIWAFKACTAFKRESENHDDDDDDGDNVDYDDGDDYVFRFFFSVFLFLHNLLPDCLLFALKTFKMCLKLGPLCSARGHKISLPAALAPPTTVCWRESGARSRSNDSPTLPAPFQKLHAEVSDL